MLNINQKNIHVISGIYSAACWEKAFPEYRDCYYIISNSLVDGELSYSDSLDHWINVCEKSLQAMFPEDGVGVDAIAKDVISNGHILKHADCITLWVGSNLKDQIAIPYFIYLMGLIGAEQVPIRLVEFKSFPSGRSSSVGIFKEEELKKHPSPLTLTSSVIALYKEAWQAICADTPYKLIELVSDTKYKLPLLQKALASLLRRYPRKDSGLLHWDFVLLKNIKAHGPLVPKIIGYSMTEYLIDLAEGDEDWVGDYYLWRRMKMMAHYTDPLISITYADELEKNSMRGCTAVLTTFGEQVLNGEVSAFPTCPIDEWIGGVHLSSVERRLWFYQDGQLYLN